MSETTMSPADMAAMMNNNGGMGNSQWNNPFMYLIWYALFRNGGFGGNSAEAASTANIDMNAKLNQLSQQISDNQATNTLNAGINSNHDYLHDFQNAMNLGFAGTNNSLNMASQGNILGQKDLQSAMQSAACGISNSILNQTNQLQSRIDQLANGTQQGFAQIGYAMAQQTNELNTNNTANTQRILDKLCSDTTQDLRDKLAEMSQTAQTQTIINQLSKTSCGCNS